ncbi:UPF0175 family protein [Candidatus Woesearchaeota archaeon]|nr:UPF0175 family protein [Candidatus Woesearchaeota archaeon]
MSTTIAARVPESVEREISALAKEHHTDKSTLVRELLTEALRKKFLDRALEKYRARTVSLGRAAELAKMPLAEFMRVAADHHIPINYSVDSLRKDFASL